jgi:uncharacterized protein (DUF4415 family)
MSKPLTKDNDSGLRRVKITDKIRQAYAERDTSLDNLDPDAPVLPPEAWANGVIGKYYRPVKTQISVRIDNEVLDWLKSKGEGHLTRINEILRKRMAQERH